MKMYPIHIAFVADKKYFQYVAVAIYSILKNADPEDELHFYIASPDATEMEFFEPLRSVKPFFLQFIPFTAQEVLPYCPDGQARSVPFIARLLLPKLIPNIDRLIYLDSDLAVTGSLRGFYYTDLSGAYAAGVEDKTAHYAHRPLLKPDYRLYINAGVLLIDAKRWRDEKAGRYFLQCVHDYPKQLIFLDQDILNYSFWGRLKPVDMKWNFHADFFNRLRLYPDNEDLPERKCRPVVWHYSIPVKPWKAGGLSHPAGRIWRQYAKACPVPVDMPSFWAEAVWTLKRLARFVWVHPGFLFSAKFWRRVKLQGFLPTIN